MPGGMEDELWADSWEMRMSEQETRRAYQLRTEHDMGMHEGAEHRDCEDCR